VARNVSCFLPLGPRSLDLVGRCVLMFSVVVTRSFLVIFSLNQVGVKISIWFRRWYETPIESRSRDPCFGPRTRVAVVIKVSHSTHGMFL
jgi:hypothetical protein